MQNRQLKKYLKKIKHTYSGSRSDKRRFLAEIQDALLCYINDHPDSTYKDIVNEFGEPSEIIYIFSFDTPYKLKRRNVILNRILLGTVIVFSVIAIIFTSIHIMNRIEYSNGYYVEYYEDDTSIPHDENPFTHEPDPSPLEEIYLD